MSAPGRKPHPLHPWNLSPSEAVALQEELRRLLVTCRIPRDIRLVAGADVSYARGSDRLFAAVVVMDLANMESVEEAWVIQQARYPYVPGLLSFREAPAVLEAFGRLRRRPQAAIFDGQGRAHPRGMGLAAHLGLWLDLPTVGCAKSRLVGQADEPGPNPGDRAPLRVVFRTARRRGPAKPRQDIRETRGRPSPSSGGKSGRIVGAVLRTRRGVKPVFVSAGHLSNLPDAVWLVLRCCAGFRLPEPVRRAHALVNRLRAEAPGMQNGEQ